MSVVGSDASQAATLRTGEGILTEKGNRLSTGLHPRVHKLVSSVETAAFPAQEAVLAWQQPSTQDQRYL
jgi:hypothetical protein